MNKEILEAAYWLKKNKVVAIPTETVYGLAATIYSEKAIKEIYIIKNRPSNNPLIVHIKSLTELEKYAQNIPEKAYLLATAFWPGPLTMVLEKSDLIPDYITANKNTVAIRVPSHKVTQELLDHLDFPIAAPSANPSNCVSATTAQHVKNYFEHKIPFILDGGSCEKGLESTIIGFENSQPIIYRLGALSIEKIEKIVGTVSFVDKKATQNPLAPGMFLKHYAPQTPFHLETEITSFLEQTEYKNIAFLGFSQSITHPKIKENFLLSLNNNFEEAAKNLYATLIEIDSQHKFDAIVALPFPNTDLGKAINDRLTRAAYKLKT